MVGSGTDGKLRAIVNTCYWRLAKRLSKTSAFEICAQQTYCNYFSHSARSRFLCEFVVLILSTHYHRCSGFISHYNERSHRKLEERQQPLKALLINHRRDIFAPTQRTMLQRACCNVSQLCLDARQRGAFADVTLSWLSLSQWPASVSKIDDSLANMLSAWYLRDGDSAWCP